MGAYWYALHSKPNKESFLWGQLTERGMECFYPRIRVKAVNPRSRKIRPYFPGYLFAYLDFDKTDPSALRWLPGLGNMVGFDNEPAIVPENIILAIRRHIEGLNAAKIQQSSDLQNGEPVSILEGPFSGYEAIFDAHIKGTERVRVLMKLLHNSRIKIELASESVQRKKRPFAPAR